MEGGRGRVYCLWSRVLLEKDVWARVRRGLLSIRRFRLQPSLTRHRRNQTHRLRYANEANTPEILE